MSIIDHSGHTTFPFLTGGTPPPQFPAYGSGGPTLPFDPLTSMQMFNGIYSLVLTFAGSTGPFNFDFTGGTGGGGTGGGSGGHGGH